MIKEKADGGDDLAKGVQDTFGEKPDSLLVRFIRARKYDVPRAFDLMKGTSGDIYIYITLNHNASWGFRVYAV